MIATAAHVMALSPHTCPLSHTVLPLPQKYLTCPHISYNSPLEYPASTCSSRTALTSPDTASMPVSAVC
jgi:hypothetical protein